MTDAQTRIGEVYVLTRRSAMKERLRMLVKDTPFDSAVYGKAGNIMFISDQAVRCRCGHIPYIQRSVYAEKLGWTIFCPACNLRGIIVGDLPDVIAAWNRDEYTEDSILVSSPLRDIDDNGMIYLLEAVFKGIKPGNRKISGSEKDGEW